MGIYQHYREEEHPFINQVLSWKEGVERSYQSKLTDFLDPREQSILTSLIGTKNEDIQLLFFGGNDYTERKRALIAPFYEEINVDDFKLTLIEATYNEKFISLVHGDVMGAFLSLGIMRNKLGDIFVTDGKLQIMTTEEIADYVVTNLTTVKNANIKPFKQSLEHLIEKEMNWVEEERTVSSLRLDVIIKDIYRLSRKDSSSLISKKLVKVNFKNVEDGTYNLYEGDLISVRGKGRSKFLSINGRSRKDKYRIKIALLK